MAEKVGEFRQKSNRRRADTQQQIDASERRIAGPKQIFNPNADISGGKVTDRRKERSARRRAISRSFGDDDSGKAWLE
jgi:hypothetical protein